MTELLHDRLESHVTATPTSASDIFRLFAGIGQHKSLTTRLRKQRRQVARALERLAEEGRIERLEVWESDPPIPMFCKKRPGG